LAPLVIVAKSISCISKDALPLLVIALLIASTGCSDDSATNRNPSTSSFEQTQEIEILQRRIKDLKWEVARLKPKVPTVDGRQMVLYKDGFWYHDVKLEPFTGRAVEKFENGAWKGEVSFFEGKKDGVERYWYPNTQISIETQWLDGRKDGFETRWNPQGKMTSRKQFHRDQKADE
jgi:antitoxin component YwqK of YwqJK toxin-antitoxin module